MKSLHIFPGCHRLHYTKLDVGSKRDFPLKTVANRNDWQILMWTPQFRRHDWTARLVEEFGWKAGLLHCGRNFVRYRPKIIKPFYTKLDVGSKHDFLLKTLADWNDWQILMWTPQFRRHNGTTSLVEKRGCCTVTEILLDLVQNLWRPFSCWRVLKNQFQN